ncbi:hypothetical protein [Phyllobacterium myrsinacearum]|uniref:hypothetical protein n=1 Tax=Phyllobacterium myrsinacearum TaxID=28101 RepID=UPI00102997F0|nr:hypothetical protein [Phyllobacterium myrsinacearum]
MFEYHLSLVKQAAIDNLPDDCLGADIRLIGHIVLIEAFRKLTASERQRIQCAVWAIRGVPEYYVDDVKDTKPRWSGPPVPAFFARAS